MRQVSLHSIYLHSFKSFTQPTTIILSKGAGLKFLGGKNLQEPRLGSNGSGKSTIWDGLCWCLTGTGTRGQKASDLVSWGLNRPHVIVSVEIDGEVFAIERHGSPNRLLINKSVATQQDVDQLIGLSRERLLQSVLFGQGVPLFLDLSTAARAELLDSVLDLDHWMQASEAAGKVLTALNAELAGIERQLSYEAGKLAGAEDEEILRKKSLEWQDSLDAELTDLIDQVGTTEDLLSHGSQDVKKLTMKLQKLPDIEALSGTLTAHETTYRRVRELNQIIQDFAQTVCPLCKQPISTHTERKLVMAMEAELMKLPPEEELEVTIADISERRSKALKEHKSLSGELVQAQADISANTRYLTKLVQHVEQVGGTVNPYIERLATLRQVVAEAHARISSLEKAKFTCAGKSAHAQYWKTGFKKVRLFQVQQVLLRMEVETANAASALGIGNWKIRFVTETETKSGTVKPGIQVLVSTPQNDGKFELYSGGEAQRVRLAVTLGIAAMVQAMAGVEFTFEVFDEASQYLSVEGIEDLLSCLQARAEITRKSVWVVDHTALSFGGFTETWEVTKDDEGSRIALLSQSN